jgi:hypothetical protein
MASRRYLVTNHRQNWGDEIRGIGNYRDNVFSDPSAAHEEALRRESGGERGVLIVPFDAPTVTKC